MTEHVCDTDTLRRAALGEEGARQAVVETNLGLVKSVARRFLGRGVEWEDLVQIGTVGMLRAIAGFDPDRACRFTTYAVPMIAGEIKRFLRDDGPVKISREIKENGARIFRFVGEYERKTGLSPTVDQIARETALSEEKVAVALAAARPILSLQAEDEETGFSPEDLVGEDSMEGAVERLCLREVVARLPAWDRRLILCRYFKNLTQQQTARLLGVTQVKVSREEKRILKTLRESWGT